MNRLQLSDVEGLATITVPEAGRVLGVGRGSAYRAAKEGSIPTLTIGGRLVVPVPRLLALLEPSPSAGGARPALSIVDAPRDQSVAGPPAA